MPGNNRLGQASAFITEGRARTLGGGGGSQNKPTNAPNFATLTEDQYREALEKAGASPKMIEQEMILLKHYKEKIDTENIRKARARLHSKREDLAQEDLGDYFDASERMKTRIRNRKEQDQDGTQTTQSWS